MFGWRSKLTSGVFLGSVVAGYALSANVLFVEAPDDTAAQETPPRSVLTPSASVAVKPDPDSAPLARGLDYRRATLGTGAAGFSYPVPDGWVSAGSDPTTAKWKMPGNPANTYVLRVEIRPAARPNDLLEEEIAQLERTTLDPQTRRKADGSVEFAYVSDTDNRLRRGLMAVVEPRNALTAESVAYVSVTGRDADLAGLIELFTTVTLGVRSAE